MKPLSRILAVFALVCVIAGVWSQGPAIMQFVATGIILGLVAAFIAAQAYASEKEAQRTAWRAEAMADPIVKVQSGTTADEMAKAAREATRDVIRRGGHQ